MNGFLLWTTWCLTDPNPTAIVAFSALLSFICVIMPSIFNKSSPFVSLRPDQDCGRQKQKNAPSSSSFKNHSGSATNDGGSNTWSNGDYSKANGYAVNGNGKGYANGYANGTASSRSYSTDNDDEFLRLSSPQQDVLLLHGPRQKYSLEKAKEIPELQKDDEVLVQVLAIGLNPVDWKGADYGFSQPSYPWVNGRDFAGIVVKAPRKPSRVQQGDVVFGPSTDYRDVRKAAYQEYVVTTDYNVARIPQGVDVKQGAALGVAFVAATISLGISFGLDFSRLRDAPAGPDFLDLVRRLDPRDVPADIRDEIFGGISKSERPQPGEWIAIWGANSTSGQLALQLAKLAGLKVACIADLAKGGSRLSEHGADFLVDRHDTKRAVEILKAVTGGKLRFGIDINGNDSAELLQQALQSSNNGPKSHILGLSGLPKEAPNGVVQHQVPIKIFHEDPNVGEEISQWLEQLLIAKSLKLPETEVADGGLAGVNTALDKLRSGSFGGKRIVVPVGAETSSPSPGTPLNGPAVGDAYDMSYADQLNSDPERVKFAYWVPNVSGGLVISKIPQRTHWDLKANERYAQTAEKVGFEYALSQIRFMAGYGAENQHEPVSLSLALMMKTQRLKLIVALLPGPWNPAVAAKMVASIDQYTEGRACVNVVSGWFKAEVSALLVRCVRCLC
jgi:NADPH:quinone reductase-like Zn-dependent oxidoreductase